VSTKHLCCEFVVIKIMWTKTNRWSRLPLYTVHDQRWAYRAYVVNNACPFLSPPECSYPTGGFAYKLQSCTRSCSSLIFFVVLNKNPAIANAKSLTLQKVCKIWFLRAHAVHQTIFCTVSDNQVQLILLKCTRHAFAI